MQINVKHKYCNFQDGYQLCFVNCDWNVFVSIKNYIKPTPRRLQTLSHKTMLINLIVLTKPNLNKQRKFQTDDRPHHNQQQGGTQKLRCQTGDGTWLHHCPILFCLRFEPDRVINSRIYDRTKQRSVKYGVGCFWPLEVDVVLFLV